MKKFVKLEFTYYISLSLRRANSRLPLNITFLSLSRINTLGYCRMSHFFKIITLYFPEENSGSGTEQEQAMLNNLFQIILAEQAMWT